MLQHCVSVVFEVKELFSEVLIVSLRATDVLGVEDVITHLLHRFKQDPALPHQDG